MSRDAETVLSAQERQDVYLPMEVYVRVAEWQAAQRLAHERQEWERVMEMLADRLENLHAMVWGECPSLLNEDSGGSGHEDIAIEAALAAYRELKGET